MPEGSLPIAIQSVVFYVLSCSSCNKITHRHKAKVQAKKEREEKHKLEMEQPGLYRHPSPFQTNPYWQEEIQMGPGPEVKKKGKQCKKDGSQRALNTAGVGSSIASTGMMSNDTSTAVDEHRFSGDGWNRKRYERPDEPMWGIDSYWPGEQIKHALTKAETTAKRLRGRLSKSSPIDESGDDSSDEERPTYMAGRNPPINDLHPPVVSTTQPANRAELAWMLQPPPSAKIMEGKERVDSLRSRGDSNCSSRPGATTPLAKRAWDNNSRLQVSPGSSRPITANSTSSNETMKQQRRKPPPITIERSSLDGHSSEDSDSDVENQRRRRPRLPTIPSSSYSVQGLALRELSPRNSSPSPSPTYSKPVTVPASVYQRPTVENVAPES